MAIAVLGMQAKSIDGKLTVTINDLTSTQDANISLDQDENGNYTLSILNFVLVTDETEIGVGNIVVDDLQPFTVAGKTTLTNKRVIDIPAGDREDIDFWIGPSLTEDYGGVPIILVTSLEGDNVVVDIDINMMETGLHQMINVNFTNVEGGQGETFEPGDVNRDGAVSGADVTALYNILLN